MIEQGTIEWLLSILQDQDSLSEYSLHYAAALMMNLCLRSSGREPHLSQELLHQNFIIRKT